MDVELEDIDLKFIPMPPVKEMSGLSETDKLCSEWVATEKVHGISFQFYTYNGEDIYMASRTPSVDWMGTFVKCDLKEFLNKQKHLVAEMHRAMWTFEPWIYYTYPVDPEDLDDDDDEDDDAERTIHPADTSSDVEDGVAAVETAMENLAVSSVDDTFPEAVNKKTDNSSGCHEGEECSKAGNSSDGCYEGGELNKADKPIKGNKGGKSDKGGAKSGNSPQKGGTGDVSEESVGAVNFELRVYGEIYGGGGVKKSIDSAIQKDIIYSDDIRFYVFGISVNRRWFNPYQLCDLCWEAPFPYYAEPVCPPQKTLEDLVAYLVSHGYMFKKSTLTEKKGDDTKTVVEGYVLVPLRRPDNKYHGVKLLAESFKDISEDQQILGGAGAGSALYDAGPGPALYEAGARHAHYEAGGEHAHYDDGTDHAHYETGAGHAHYGAERGPAPGGAVKRNYCTKARYLSVLGRLDEEGRRNTERVKRLFIKDMERESGVTLDPARCKAANKAVQKWLKKDGYV